MQYVTWPYKWHYNIYILHDHKNSNSGNLKSFITSLLIDDVHYTFVTKTCLLNEQKKSYSPNIFSGVSVICYVREIQIKIQTLTPPRLHFYSSIPKISELQTEWQNLFRSPEQRSSTLPRLSRFLMNRLLHHKVGGAGGIVFRARRARGEATWRIGRKLNNVT